MLLQEVHERNINKSALLSSYQVPNLIPLLDIVRVLNEARIRFVLVGAYGLSGWRQKPRATEDVDVVVAARQLKKAVKALLEAFPHLEAVDLPGVTRLRKHGTEDVVIDVMKPLQQPYREVFKYTEVVTTEGQTYRVPSLEMALVMKFAAMTSPYRAESAKHQDAHDFILMVENNPGYDREELAELGSLIYPDGGKDVVEMARKVLAGEKLNL